MQKRIVIALFVILAATLAFAHDHGQHGQKAEPAAQALTKVESKMVCMVNEHNMGKEQIKVEVEGKTYYGCCDMCKAALENDVTKRFGTDPISGIKVDKATAVIGAQEDGKVFYFENEENFRKYNEKAAAKK